MKKNQTMQGTFSKLFGKKHANPATTSLYATNPPWIFTQEAQEEGPRDFDGIYYENSRFNTVSESGTATLKARPRVRPLLTFLPLNAQENHGLAVPTPSVPEDFADKEVGGTSSLVNGSLRLYSSVGDLRPAHYELDSSIPPPPPGPAPGPPQETSQPPGESPPPPPPAVPPPPPPLLVEPPPPPPPSTAPPPPPVLDTLSPSSALSPPSTPTPPDFIPPAPPSAFLNPPPPSLPVPGPPTPVSPHTTGTRLFPTGGIIKWKSEVALNGRQPEDPRTSPPKSPAALKGPSPESHLTFPRSFKVPPPTPVRTSSIPVQEVPGASPEEEASLKASTHLLPPSSFSVRPASQVYPDRAPEPEHTPEPRLETPGNPRLGQPEPQTNGQAGVPPPAPPLPPPAPPLPPPAPSLPPAAPPLPPTEQAVPPSSGFMKTPKSSSPTLNPKPNPPTPEDTASSEPVDWRDPRQMEKLRSELAAYLCGTRKEDRSLSHRPVPKVALKDNESKKDPSLAEEAPPSLPEKTDPCGPEKSNSSNSLPDREATSSLTLPPVDYIPQDTPAPSVRQIRNELEARFSSSAEKEAKPSIASLPPKPRLEGGRIFENGTDHGRFHKPVTKNPPQQSATALPATPPQSKITPGPATPPKATPGPATPPQSKTTPGPGLPLKPTPEQATSPKDTPGQATSPKDTPGLSIPSCQQVAEKDLVPVRHREKPEPQANAAATQLSTNGARSPPALPPKMSTGGEEVPFLYRFHRSQNSHSRGVAVVIPTRAKGEATDSGGLVDEKEPENHPAKPLAPVQPADQLLRHPVTGEVVERGSPMALLLAARQRAQKSRPGGTAGTAMGPGRSSLPGSLRDHGNQTEASSDTIFYRGSRPNSFLVVPKVPSETEGSHLTSARPAGASQWKPQQGRDTQGPEPTHRHGWTKAESHAAVTRERHAPSSLSQGRALPKSFSSPPSPSYKKEEEEEFSFDIIPPPPEFSNDPEPHAGLQHQDHRGSPPRNNYSDLGQPLDLGSGANPARGFSRFAGTQYSGLGGLDRFSGSGRSLIKKRLYVGESHRNPGTPRGATGRSMSSPNCFGPQPGGPEMRRVNSAGRAAPGGLNARRLSLEGARGAAEVKYKTPSGGGGGSGGKAGDYGFIPAKGSRSPHYGSPINTFTVRPGTRHPISYAYSGTHRKAAS
ncbi:uncharacterized protein C6orf132 homolog [Chionomys nivalis]|uniref:uncharacterized protein C6orf132 homolog n=1 Tax=Chionomys nivalis TaxID=269649 RepID=UPI0025953C2C|nr:uncharacterized protein C6orf132 homolog [Chionomys nivalis]